MEYRQEKDEEHRSSELKVAIKAMWVSSAVPQASSPPCYNILMQQVMRVFYEQYNNILCSYLPFLFFVFLEILFKIGVHED